MEDQLNKSREKENKAESCNENLEKLRRLVDELEGGEEMSDLSDSTLSDIENVIKSERSIIEKLKKPDSKLRHYELICNSILTLIATTNG